MIKKIGFFIILLSLLVCLRPNLFKGMFSSNESNDKDLIDRENLVAATRGVGESTTEYAEGYSSANLGEVFDHPMDGKFVVEKEMEPVGPWEDLLTLKFDIRFDESVDDVIFEPKISKRVRQYEGKIIEVEGFIIPHDIAADAMADLDDDGQQFMFSAFPLASCFFCGGAGAESVMEAFPKKPISYTERKIKIRGRLEFNTTDFLKLPYQLKDVVVVEDNL
ncbi:MULTISPECIES: hypothetical protein [unclassified Aureispira]|uniref:hypothetical protein n=1 Tax=unclassified Aureispira TaxID=2649989 RepID=UPI000696B205|nr:MULTISPECIES: hypothetical protein [unclassified Aureispira]WMX16905.1 hypothetical protein QP953_11030 [Aureispira sp. CCB-E]